MEMKLGQKHDKYIKEFSDRGMVVLPCKNKFPQLKNWQKMKKSPLPDESLSTHIANKYKAAWFDATGYGFLCGAVSGISVIDVDTDDMDWIIKFMQHHKIPTTTTCITPSGGFHLYYKYNKHLKTTTRLGGVSIDIRNDRSFIVAPGSPYDTNVEAKKKYIGTDYEFAVKDGKILNFDVMQEVPQIFLEVQDIGVNKETFEIAEKNEQVVQTKPVKRKRKFGIIEEEDVKEEDIVYPSERKTTPAVLMKLMNEYAKKHNSYDEWLKGLWVWFAAGEDNDFDGLEHADAWSQQIPGYKFGEVEKIRRLES